MICKIIVLVFLIFLETFIYISQVSASEQTSRSKSTEHIKTVVQETPSPSSSEQADLAPQGDNINDVDDSNITTKIYKSNEPTSELLEDLSNLDSSTEQDILNKEELIGKRKNSKAVRRLKDSKFETDKQQINNFTIIPWLMLVVLVLVLGFIFRLLKQKKV